MEHSPWDSNSSSASQEIPRILSNVQAPYHFHKNMPVFHFLSHNFQFYVFKMYINIILSSIYAYVFLQFSIFKIPHITPCKHYRNIILFAHNYCILCTIRLDLSNILT
jgi:hypothetical protein